MTQPPLKLPDTAPLAQPLADGRLLAPSATRNAEPIFARLGRYVPDSGVVLELASGTGQHIAGLAQQYRTVDWQPSDLSPDRMASVQAWRAHVNVPNLRSPILLDASGEWPDVPGLGLIYVVNLFHLIPKAAAQQVIAGAAGALETGGHFFIYGPFRTGGAFRSDGDAAFHASLVGQDAAIGYKDLEWMQAELSVCGLTLCDVHEMPANNLALVARRAG